MSALDSIFSDDWGADHRSGLVAVVGKPNVGKSTLINAILGQKIAIVSAKPQTTRQHQLGIYTSDAAQILFIDTPGIHKPRNSLGNYMAGAARKALREADVVMWLVDASLPPTGDDQRIADMLTKLAPSTPRLLLLNKIDLVSDQADLAAHRALCQHLAALETSALQRRGLDAILGRLIPLLPLGPRLYPAEQASEVNLRFIAAEAIREKIIDLTSDEIPHAVAVEITRFRERGDITIIEANLFVERQSQKGILIGRRGAMIREIGIQARAELEDLLEAPVHLETRVKVLKNWRGNERFMRRVGYIMPGRGRD